MNDIVKKPWFWAFIIVDAIVVGILIYWAIRDTSSPPAEEEEPAAMILDGLAPGASTMVELNATVFEVKVPKGEGYSVGLLMGIPIPMRLAISIVGLCVAVAAIPEILNGGYQTWLRAGIREIPDAIGRTHSEFVGIGVLMGLLGHLAKFGLGAWMFCRPDFFHRWVNVELSDK